MGVPQIPNAKNGDGHALSVWGYSNKSASMRFGALVALSNLPGASPLDVLVYGEIKAPATTAASKLIGVCSIAGPENTLSNPLAADETGVTATPVSSAVGRHPFILSPNSTLSQDAPYLMADPAVPGNVVPWVAGSGMPPVARALNYPASSASEQYVEGEFLPGLLGLDALPGDLITGDATDAALGSRFVARAGVHIAPATAQQTPVLYVSRGQNYISNLRYALATAPGPGFGVRIELKKGATPQAANAAAASTFAEILDTATSGAPTGGAGQPTGFWMADGEVLVAATSSVAGGVGAALHSMVSFRAQ